MPGQSAQEILDLVEGPLRLAAKYELTALHSHLAGILKASCPMALNSWDEHIPSLQQFNTFLRSGLWLGAKPKSGPPYPIVNLALPGQLRIPELMCVLY